jgi:hypothetical protein
MANSPIQQTPEYVFNPLAIYRMARRCIQERHLPEATATSQSALAEINTSSDLGQRREQHNLQYQDNCTVSAPPIYHPAAQAAVNASTQAALGPEIYTQEIPHFNVAGALAMSWQPADTILEGIDWTDSLPPWANTDLYWFTGQHTATKPG